MIAAVTARLARAAAMLPGARIHERHVRRNLGMARRHPERLTMPPRRREAVLLGAIQAGLWPENEWCDVIEAHIRGTW